MLPVYFGIAFSLAALILMLREDWSILTRGRRAKGVVLGHQKGVEDGSEVYAPIVRFRAESGEDIEFVDRVFSQIVRLSVGDTVELIHPRDAPEKARLRRPLKQGLAYLAVLFILLIFIARAFGWLPEGNDQSPTGL